MAGRGNWGGAFICPARILGFCTMIQASLPKVSYNNGEWFIHQDFIKISGERVTCRGWGWTRADAFKALQYEIEQEAALKPYDWLEDFGNFLMDFVEPFELTIKAVIKAIRDFMRFIYEISEQL